MSHRILYRSRESALGFEPYIAPSGFSRAAQPVDIYQVFKTYYRNHPTAKYIYSVSDSAATTLGYLTGLPYLPSKSLVKTGMQIIKEIKER